MINSTYHFDFKDLKLSSSVIESVLGYKEGDDREFVKSLIEETLAESWKISNIKAQFTVFDDVHFEDETKTVEIAKIKFRINKVVFGQLKKSDSVAIFLCTAGQEIGVRSRQAMQERDFLKGYIYDVIGSEIVEAASDLMQADLEKISLGSGKRITNRYSPGYCGWDVGEQHKLFQLIPENYCGIKLTPSALMDPVKSVSGIIGIGKNVRFNTYTCRMCKQEDCAYRRVSEKMKQQE
ncbi:MAG: vitamin B12 dependent-methionine synthase activation domain-containing protein [Bacteroidales bacterium]